MQTKGQLIKSLNTAFSFAPPSILFLTIYLLSSSFLFLFNHVAPKHKEVEPRHRYITPIPTSLVKFNIALTQKSKDVIKYNNAVILFLFIMCTPSNSNLLLKSYHIFKHISIPIVSAPIYCIAFRLASVTSIRLIFSCMVSFASSLK